MVFNPFSIFLAAAAGFLQLPPNVSPRLMKSSTPEIAIEAPFFMAEAASYIWSPNCVLAQPSMYSVDLSPVAIVDKSLRV